MRDMSHEARASGRAGKCKRKRESTGTKAHEEAQGLIEHEEEHGTSEQ